MHNLINKKTKLLYAILTLCFLLLGIGFAGQNISAQKPLEVVYPGNNAPITTDTPLPDYVRYIYIMAVTIVGLIILGVFIRAGYTYLTSTGAPSSREEAKKRIIAAFLGTIILLSSFLILYTLNPQLVTMNIGSPEKAPTSTPPVASVSTTTEKTFTFFQIPTGMLIERSLLDGNAKIVYDTAMASADNLEEKSEKLKNAAEELKALTDACQCNQSSCSAIDGASGAGCSKKGCPWAVCDKNAIEKKIDELKTAIADLQGAETQVSLSNFSIKDNSLDFQKAGMLMSLLGDEIEDYNSMLASRYSLEKDGYNVEFEYFPGWDDITIRSGNFAMDDPATFYFNKEGKDNLFDEYITPLTASDVPVIPFNDMPIPPPIPGKFAWPLGNNITQPYGCLATAFARKSYPACKNSSGASGGFHNGMDFGAAGTDYRLRAAADGVVLDTGSHPTGYGNWIAVQHSQLGITTVYCHLRSTSVNVGDTVTPGEIIAIADNTGYSTGAHLHFMVYNGTPTIITIGSKRFPRGNTLDPAGYLP